MTFATSPIPEPKMMATKGTTSVLLRITSTAFSANVDGSAVGSFVALAMCSEKWSGLNRCESTGFDEWQDGRWVSLLGGHRAKHFVPSRHDIHAPAIRQNSPQFEQHDTTMYTINTRERERERAKEREAPSRKQQYEVERKERKKERNQVTRKEHRKNKL